MPLSKRSLIETLVLAGIAMTCWSKSRSVCDIQSVRPLRFNGAMDEDLRVVSYMHQKLLVMSVVVQL